MSESSPPAPDNSEHARDKPVGANPWHGRVQLACFNFFGAVIKDGLGPFVSVYLVTTLGWDPGRAGLVWFAREVAKLSFQVPAGLLVDWTKHKKAVLGVTVIAATLPAVSILWWDSLPWMICKSIIEGMATSIIDPAKAAITLGNVGAKRFDAVSKVNEMCDHGGSLFGGVVAGFVAYYSFPDVGYLFIVIGGMGVLALLSVLLIPNTVVDKKGQTRRSIDNDVARGAKHKGAKASSIRQSLTNVNVVLFAVSCFFFHFGNAAVLPLLAQFIAIVGDERAKLPYTAANIAVAQISSILFAWLMALLVQKGYGYRTPVCIGFSSLPLRCGVVLALVYGWPNPYALIATQLLDGVGAGVYGLAQLTVTRALTAGTGRFSATLGFVIFCHALGAALSHLVAGYVVTATSYQAGFVFLGCVGLVPLPLLLNIRIPKPESQAAGDVRVTREPSEPTTTPDPPLGGAVDHPRGSG